VPCIFSYVAPEYASTGMLNERSDVYGFGVLTTEIISGRSPVDYALGEVRIYSDLQSIPKFLQYSHVTFNPLVNFFNTFI